MKEYIPQMEKIEFTNDMYKLKYKPVGDVIIIRDNSNGLTAFYQKEVNVTIFGDGKNIFKIISEKGGN